MVRAVPQARPFFQPVRGALRTPQGCPRPAPLGGLGPGSPLPHAMGMGVTSSPVPVQPHWDFYLRVLQNQEYRFQIMQWASSRPK